MRLSDQAKAYFLATKEPQNNNYVYFIQFNLGSSYDGMIKIGTTNNLVNRMKHYERQYYKVDMVLLFTEIGSYNMETTYLKMFKYCVVDSPYKAIRTNNSITRRSTESFIPDENMINFIREKQQDHIFFSELSQAVRIKEPVV